MASNQTTGNNDNVLDLHDVALLLNYERASTEPRFRHAKLRELATTSNFQTVRLLTPDWTEATVPRTGMVFDKPKKLPGAGSKEDAEPDLPSNMLPDPISASLRDLTPKQLETLYWQARNHDGCYRTVTLFQHFIDLFPNPDNVPIRVRTVDNNAPKAYTTPAGTRIILEMKLMEPRSMTLACVLPDNQTYISGGQDVIDHAVLAFSETGQNIESILDLASLQFGDVGRGCKGRGLFVLEPVNDYVARLDRYARDNNFEDGRHSLRINDAPDSAWLRQVAKRVKERWDNRKTEHWCGHCGAPAKTLRFSFVSIGLAVNQTIAPVLIGCFLTALAAVPTFGLKGSKWFVLLRGAIGIVWWVYYAAEMVNVV
ncbi:hypothetical protein CVT25_003482 [Psilocybe cyanescens]|uniref:Uncharacterized protein n=1 Tax=Psilocybe cyanescens TaxID=93625 RepID=A0A409WM90_PSICY|nr:hypothetical protein CVT25_003482 [Psilocybe cyanescens]